MNLQPYYENCDFLSSYPQNGMGGELFHKGLCLPSDINMGEEDLERVVTSLKEQL
jgi:dTDP-4-amino-4,6-dideoxygalactose transaminase